jgi:hypothetical protein
MCWSNLTTLGFREAQVDVDHSTINRWVIKYSPQLEEAFHRRKRPVWTSWRMDETYIKVKGTWRYLSRAVDKYGETIDFLLTEQRDKEAVLRFLKKAIRRNGVPETICIGCVAHMCPYGYKASPHVPPEGRGDLDSAPIFLVPPLIGRGRWGVEADDQQSRACRVVLPLL